ncbi:AraC family transcriptional regulator [Paenibacillaceae bacterium]|nr:AraC family transcriptional regulator [Paenibacillaceae bacterium]
MYALSFRDKEGVKPSMKLVHMMGRHNLFIRLLVPYLLFILLALLLGWHIYTKTLHLVENEVTHNNLLLLEQVKVTLDRRLAEVEMVAQQLKNDPKVMRLQQVTEPFEGATTFRVWNTQKGLYNFSVSNSFILDYYIFYNKSNLVLSPNSTYEMPKFYQSILRYPDMDFDEWRERFFDGYQNRQFLPAQRTIYQDKLYDMIIYRQSLGYPGDEQGSIAVLIDNWEVQKLLGGLVTEDGGSVYILDGQGQVISSVPSDLSHVTPIQRDQLALDAPQGLIGASDKTDGMTITYTTSAQNGWAYIVAQPPHIVLKKVFYIKKITFSLAILFLLVGVILAYFFTYRNSKPVKAIVSTLKERISGDHGRTDDTFGFIQRTVSNLIDNNAELQEEIHKQAPFLRATLFERLLKGDFVGEKNIEASLLHQKLHLNDPFYAVAILRFTGYDSSLSEEMLMELDYKRVILKEELRKHLSDMAHYHDVSEDKIALLFFDGSDCLEDCRHRIDQALKLLTDEILVGLNISFVIGVGSICESLSAISLSYEEARQALVADRRENVGGVTWHEALPPNESGGYYYPVEFVARLMNVTKAGDWKEADKLLDDLYRQNFIDRHLPMAMRQLFIFDMVANLIKLNEQMVLNDMDDIKSLLGQAHSSDDPVVIFHSVKEWYRSICDKVNERKSSQNAQLLDDIIKLVSSSYMEAELSLDAAADRLNISKVYLSQFFKDQNGVNFSDYLENLRMERARHLLATTELTVNDIAGQVGYNSSNTFCRAFKRINGLSAMVYRNSSIPRN